jgi:hypothetical protein
LAVDSDLHVTLVWVVDFDVLPWRLGTAIVNLLGWLRDVPGV